MSAVPIKAFTQLSDRLKISLHKERLRATVEPLTLGKRRKLRPDEGLHLSIGPAVVFEKREVVVNELSALPAAGVFLDVFAVVVYAEVADHDVGLPRKRRFVFRHVPEAALLAAAHGIEVDATAGVSEVAYLVFSGGLFVQHLL